MIGVEEEEEEEDFQTGSVLYGGVQSVREIIVRFTVPDEPYRVASSLAN